MSIMIWKGEREGEGGRERGGRKGEREREWRDEMDGQNWVKGIIKLVIKLNYTPF